MAEEKVRTSETEIAGTRYIIECRECETAKETPYSKIKRLITTNAKSLVMLSNHSDLSAQNHSTSSK